MPINASRPNALSRWLAVTPNACFFSLSVIWIAMILSFQPQTTEKYIRYAGMALQLGGTGPPAFRSTDKTGGIDEINAQMYNLLKWTPRKIGGSPEARRNLQKSFSGFSFSAPIKQQRGREEGHGLNKAGRDR